MRQMVSWAPGKNWPGQAWLFQPYEANAFVGAWPGLARAGLAKCSRKHLPHKAGAARSGLHLFGIACNTPLIRVACYTLSQIRQTTDDRRACRLSSVCRLSVVCRLLPVVCRLSSVVCRLSSIVCRLSSVVCRLSSPREAPTWAQMGPI